MLTKYRGLSVPITYLRFECAQFRDQSSVHLVAAAGRAAGSAAFSIDRLPQGNSFRWFGQLRGSRAGGAPAAFPKTARALDPDGGPLPPAGCHALRRKNALSILTSFLSRAGRAAPPLDC